MTTYTFHINPIGKPRMVRSDTWAGRSCVARYWAFKDELNLIAKGLGYKLGETLTIKFYLAMPESWSEKKKIMIEGCRHKQKPDLDNLIKSFLDCLTTDDSKIWEISASKIWARVGRIEVEEVK